MSAEAVLGMGTWPLGGHAYGAVDGAEARRALLAAYNGGIRWFDTADIYGDGDVETLMGEALSNLPDVRVVTKAGYLTEKGRQQSFDPSRMRRCLVDSLKRLRRDRVDLFLLHSPPDQVLCDARLRNGLKSLCEEGFANGIGVSLAHIDQYELLVDWEDLQAVELIYNLLDQRAAERGILQDAHARERRIIARLPLSGGFLTGKYSATQHFGEDDTRQQWPPVQITKWVTAAARFGFLQQGARSLAQAALAFCLASPGVFAVIPGMKSVRQVNENISTLLPHVRLSDQEFEQARLLWPTIADVPPR